MLIEATNPTDHRLRQNLEPTNLANFTNPANLANLTNPCNSTNPDNLPNHPNLTDKELYATCKKWGAQALHSRRKFAGYLPEVNKREMSARVKGKSWFERRGYKNIYNFAARLAGMSKDQVNTVLRLSQRFTNMPILREALTEGKISHHKLLRIAAIATIENQMELLKKALVLSKAALDIFVRDYKKEHFTTGHGETFCGNESQLMNLFNEKLDGSLMPKFNNNCLPGQTQNAESPLEQANLKSVSENEENPNNSTFKNHNQNGSNNRQNTTESYHPFLPATDINQDVKLMQKLSPELKFKLIHMDQKGLNINEILLELLQKRDKEIAEEKDQLAVEEIERTKSFKQNQRPTRHVRIRIKKILQKEYGTKCGEPNCSNPAQQIHHALPFAIHHSHNPNHLKPLCKAHHEIAHAYDPNVQKYRQFVLMH